MSSFTTATLRLYLVDALEPTEAARVDAAIAADPALAARLDALRATGWPPRLDPPGPWRVPPPDRRAADSGVAGGVLGEVVVRVGDVCRIQIAAPPDLAAREVMVLRLDGARWQVEIPQAAAERTPAELLARDGDRLCVDFLARPPGGDQRWAVALPLASEVDGIDFAAPDWSAVQQRIARRQVPVRAVDIEVAT